MALAFATITYRFDGKHLVEKSRAVHRPLSAEEEKHFYGRVVDSLKPAFDRFLDQKRKEMMEDAVT